MKTSPKHTSLFSILAVCLPLAPAFGQDLSSSPKPQTPMIHVTRDTRNFNPNCTPAIQAARLATERKTWAAIARGETALKAGGLDDAINAFQEALSYEPDNGLAYQRLAEAQTAAGYLHDAAASYRTVLYDWPGKNWSGSVNGDPVVHMQFALLLLRLNQRAEALSVYQHGYHLLQSETAGSAYMAAKTVIPPMLAAQNFTAPQLEAAADTVIGIHKYNWDGQSLAAADFQRVLKLQPESAVAHFYLGQIYKFQTGHAAEAVKEFGKAAQLGGPEMQPFVEKARKEGL